MRHGAAPALARTQRPERLQKVLADLGVGSRREAERWILAARLTVNGKTAVLGTRVTPQDRLELDGRAIRRHAPGHAAAAAASVVLCHRSPGLPLLPMSGERARVPAAEQGLPAELAAAARSTAERLPRRLGRRFISVSPMPAIDGGLELLTADGGLAVRLQRAVRSLEVEFSVRVRGQLGPAQLEVLRQGSRPGAPRIEVRTLEESGGEASNRWYRLVVVGGSGREVRALFESHGVGVARVLRTRLGALALPRTLARGQWRELERQEISALLGSRGSAR